MWQRRHNFILCYSDGGEEQFDISRCSFVFNFFMNQVNVGKIRVMSSPLLIQHKFVQSLGQFCFRKPIEFYIDKPKVNNYIKSTNMWLDIN